MGRLDLALASDFMGGEIDFLRFARIRGVSNPYGDLVSGRLCDNLGVLLALLWNIFGSRCGILGILIAFDNALSKGIAKPHIAMQN